MCAAAGGNLSGVCVCASLGENRPCIHFRRSASQIFRYANTRLWLTNAVHARDRERSEQLKQLTSGTTPRECSAESESSGL